MKKLLLMIAAVCLLISCQKKDADPVVTEQEVVFSALKIFPDGALKSTDLWECNDLSIDYAKMKIGEDFYYSEVYSLDGILYTQSLKMTVPPEGNKTYYLNEFFLMHDFGTKGPGLEDSIVMATPSSTGPYKEYVRDPVSMSFTVNAFFKAEIPIDVLCFNASEIEGFGFDWFQITEIMIRTQCFFGDICLDGNNNVPPAWTPDDYAGSLYDAQQLPPGVLMDVPAIFEIYSFRNGEELPLSPLSNASVEYGYGAGFPLCIEYPDQVTLDGEIFTFDLWVLVRNSAGGFSYQYYDTYTCIDDGPITRGSPAVPATGPEGIVDFAIGICSPMSTNIYPWQVPPPIK